MASIYTAVIPAKARIHLSASAGSTMGSRLRENDIWVGAIDLVTPTTVIPAQAGIQCHMHNPPPGTTA
jgi:hypothetical protein